MKADELCCGYSVLLGTDPPLLDTSVISSWQCRAKGPWEKGGSRAGRPLLLLSAVDGGPKLPVLQQVVAGRALFCSSHRGGGKSPGCSVSSPPGM